MYSWLCAVRVFIIILNEEKHHLYVLTSLD